MLRFILTGLCLLQVTYSSYICPGSKPPCFPPCDPISTNDIREDPFCSKQPKETSLQFSQKSLHRFQPFCFRQHKFSTLPVFGDSPRSIPTSEKIITGDFCSTESKECGTEAPQVNRIPDAFMKVVTPTSGPQDTICEVESYKEYPICADIHGRVREDISDESSTEDEVIPSSDPIAIDGEGYRERQSCLNPPDNISLNQCPENADSLSDEVRSVNPSSIIPEAERGTSTDGLASAGTECDPYAQKHEQCTGSLEDLGGQIESYTTTNPGETQLTQVPEGPADSQQEIAESSPTQSVSLDTGCENISSACAVGSNELSPPPLNAECGCTTAAPIVKESVSGTAIPPVTDLGHSLSSHTSCSQVSPGITQKIICGNPVPTLISNPCTPVLSNLITGLSSVSSKPSPSPFKPIYEEVIRHVPTIRNEIRHHLVETTHHVPIVEKIVQHERQDIIRHIPVIQKFTRNIVECRTKHVPVLQHRKRTVEERYIAHVPRTEKITRPVIETLVKHVPVVFSRYKPVVSHRIRHVPTVETRCVPVLEETITTVPVKRKIIKHVVENRIRPIIQPWGSCPPENSIASSGSVTIGLGHHC